MTEQQKEYQREWRMRNKDKVREQAKRYAEAHREEIKARQKAYRERNKERIRKHNNEYMKGYCERNKEKISEYHKAYYQENAEKVKGRVQAYKESQKERVDAYNRQYRAEHSKEHAEYIKKRRLEDPKYKMVCAVRNMLNNAFNKRMKVGKKKQAEEILGCSIEFFIEYLQSQFKEGMTIENHGEWHIDHIIPLSSAKTEEDVIKLNHYTNLQPLWAKDNISKRNKIS